MVLLFKSLKNVKDIFACKMHKIEPNENPATHSIISNADFLKIRKSLKILKFCSRKTRRYSC